MFEKPKRKKYNQNTAHPGIFFSMANFFRTRLRDSLRNGDAWGLSQNWQPRRRCHREERIFVFLFFFFVWKNPDNSRPSKRLKRIGFLGIVDEVKSPKVPRGIPKIVKNQLQKIRVFLQLVVIFSDPYFKIMIFLYLFNGKTVLYSLYPSEIAG